MIQKVKVLEYKICCPIENKSFIFVRVFLTTRINKADCVIIINKKALNIGTVGQKYYIVLYHDATDYTTVYHLTPLREKYSSYNHVNNHSFIKIVQLSSK